MIIELIGRSFLIIVNMAGSPSIVIEWTSEIAMKIYLKAKEVGEHIQTFLCK